MWASYIKYFLKYFCQTTCNNFLFFFFCLNMSISKTKDTNLKFSVPFLTITMNQEL